MLDTSPVCLPVSHTQRLVIIGLTRDQEIHFKQRYFKSGQFQLRILSGAERLRKSAEWVLEHSVSLYDVYVSGK